MATWQEVAATVANLAPVAGATLGGPLGAGIGIAIKALAEAFGIQSPSPQPQEVLQAITGDPQALLKLDSARLAYEQERMKEETERLRLGLADIQNARAREVEIVKTTGKRDINQYVLAWTLIAGFFALLAVLMFRALPADSTGVIFMLFGALSAGFGQVTSYFFGSSKGSSEKTALLTQGNSGQK